jgi:hypothetical protein
LRKSEVGHDQQKEKTMRDFGGHGVFFFFFSAGGLRWKTTARPAYVQDLTG